MLFTCVCVGVYFGLFAFVLLLAVCFMFAVWCCLVLPWRLVVSVFVIVDFETLVYIVWFLVFSVLLVCLFVARTRSAWFVCVECVLLF